MRWVWGLLFVAGCSVGDGSGDVQDTDAPMIGGSSGGPETSTPSQEDGTGPSGASSAPDASAGSSETSDGASDTDDPSDTSSTPRCLDGVLDVGEQCDDGNEINGDGCNRDCQFSAQLVWQTTYGTGLGQIDQAYDIAPRADGSAVVVGYVSAAAEGARDAWIGRYNSAGTLAWDTVIAGPGGGNDEIRAVSNDPNGGVYVAGYVSGPKGQGLDAWVARYTLEGEQSWVESFNGPDSRTDVFDALVVDAEGNLIVGGYSQSLDNGNDIFLRKLAPDGAVLWSRVFPGPNGGTDLIRDLDVSPAGHVYAGGYQEGPEGEGRNAWLGKYDADGNEIWSRSFNGPEGSNDYVIGVSVLGEDDVVISGYEEATDIPWQAVVRRYDSLGMTVWTDRYTGGSAEGAHGFGVEVDADGAIVVTGGEILGGVRHVLVRKYDDAGGELWTTIVPGGAEGPDYGREVAIGPTGAVWLAGALDTGADARDVWVGRFTP